MTLMNKGIWYAIGAYGSWGLLPLYWKMLSCVTAPQLLCHRIIWSFGTLLLIIAILRQWKSLKDTLSAGILRIYFLAAILIGINWLVFIWAVNSGHIVESSLGYFINPLLSVLIGVIFFRERLRLWQWISICIAATGVLYLSITLGSLPWIALTLAFSFALYGVVKKIAPLSSLHGLMLETSILLIPALGFLFFAEHSGNGAFLHSGILVDTLLIGAGITTTAPLLMFTAAAKRIPLSFIGILQYIAPTTQFLLGVLLYREVFTSRQFIGYSFVWLALAIFAIDSISTYRIKHFHRQH